MTEYEKPHENTLRVLYHVVHSYQIWRDQDLLPNELTDDAVRVGEQHLREMNWWPEGEEVASTNGLRSVDVHLLHQSSPISRTDVVNTYTKDGLFCVLRSGGLVEKYPLLHIFRVTEYG